jgi:hypothetical protein
LVDVLLVCTSTGLLIDRVRRLSLCVLIKFVLLERGRDAMVLGGCSSWVVFECPCVSVVSAFWVISYEQTTQNGTLRVLPATLFMLAVLLAEFRVYSSLPTANRLS